LEDFNSWSSIAQVEVVWPATTSALLQYHSTLPAVTYLPAAQELFVLLYFRVTHHKRGQGRFLSRVLNFGWVNKDMWLSRWWCGRKKSRSVMLRKGAHIGIVKYVFIVDGRTLASHFKLIYRTAPPKHFQKNIVYSSVENNDTWMWKTSVLRRNSRESKTLGHIHKRLQLSRNSFARSKFKSKGLSAHYTS